MPVSDNKRAERQLVSLGQRLSVVGRPCDVSQQAVRSS